MVDYNQLGEKEERFANIIWENEPIRSAELAQRAEEEFGWKLSTSYTVLKRLCKKGLFQNKKAIVTSLVKKEEFDSVRSNAYVDKAFGGSLPVFLSAFLRKQTLTKEQAEKLHRMVDERCEQ